MIKTRGHKSAGGLLILVCSALALCIGCSGDDKDEESAAFRHRALWESHGIANYRYELKQGCFCDPITNLRVLITVTNNAISSVHDIEADAPISADYWNRFKTIDQLFETVIRAEREADSLDVEYDDQYGYPAVIDIYWDHHATDNGWIAEASNLEVAN